MPMDTAPSGEGKTLSPEKYKFGSVLNTIVILLGFSLGSSDFWKFPFLVYRNGGGSFLIPYLITLALCGCPLYFLEYSLGIFSGKGPYLVWDICPLFRGFGISVVLLYYGYLVTSTILRCWLIEFFVNSFRDPLPWSHCNNSWNTEQCREHVYIQTDTFSTVNNSLSCGNGTGRPNLPNCTASGYMLNETVATMSATEEYWQYSVLHLSTGISDMSTMVWRLVLYMFILRVLLSLVVIKSVKWLETVMYFTTFIPLIISAVILISSLTKPGATTGLYHYFYPDLEKLHEARVWLEAALMVFYTLSFGWGCIILLGSHTKFHDNCLRTSLMMPYIDALCPLFTGMVCFSVLGNMAHTLNVPVTQVITAEMSSGLVGYASALATLPYPQIWSVLFFFSVIITSVDNQSVAIEMAVQYIGETIPGLFPTYRLHTLALVTIVLFLASLPTCTGAGVYIMLLNDWYSGTWCSPLLALGQLLVVGWIYGLDRFSYDVKLMLGRPLITWYRICISVVCPIVVLAIFVTSCFKYVPPTYGSYSFSRPSEMCSWLSVLLFLCPVPVYAFVRLVKGQGQWKQTLSSLLDPLPSWGPCDKQAMQTYQQNVNLRRMKRNFTSTLRFNLCGVSRLNSDGSEEELMDLRRRHSGVAYPFGAR